MSNQPYILHANAPERDNVRANLHAFIDRLPASKSWSIVVGPYHKPRSDKQRSALFAVAYAPIMEFMGLRGEDDKQYLHTFWMCEFFGRHPELPNKPLRTTTKNERGERDVITTVVALDFYKFIQQRAAEQGIDVPDPDPFWKENAAREGA